MHNGVLSVRENDGQIMHHTLWYVGFSRPYDFLGVKGETILLACHQSCNYTISWQTC